MARPPGPTPPRLPPARPARPPAPPHPTPRTRPACGLGQSRPPAGRRTRPGRVAPCRRARQSPGVWTPGGRRRFAARVGWGRRVEWLGGRQRPAQAPGGLGRHDRGPPGSASPAQPHRPPLRPCLQVALHLLDLLLVHLRRRQGQQALQVLGEGGRRGVGIGVRRSKQRCRPPAPTGLPGQPSQPPLFLPCGAWPGRRRWWPPPPTSALPSPAGHAPFPCMPQAGRLRRPGRRAEMPGCPQRRRRCVQSRWRPACLGQGREGKVGGGERAADNSAVAKPRS